MEVEDFFKDSRNQSIISIFSLSLLIFRTFIDLLEYYIGLHFQDNYKKLIKFSVLMSLCAWILLLTSNSLALQTLNEEIDELN